MRSRTSGSPLSWIVGVFRSGIADPATVASAVVAGVGGWIAGMALFRVLWVPWKRAVFVEAGPPLAEVSAVVAATPFDVILLQVTLSAVLGLVLAADLLCYRGLSALPLHRGQLSRRTRAVLAPAALAALPVGGALGHLFVLRSVAPMIWSMTTVPVVELLAVAFLVSLAAGVALQSVVAVGVVSVARLLGTTGRS